MRASARRLFFSKRRVRRSTWLFFARPKKSQQKKGHPANAAFRYFALRVPDRRSLTRFFPVRDCDARRIRRELSVGDSHEWRKNGVGVKLTPTPEIQRLSLRRSIGDCGNPDFEIATPCYARFAMTRKAEKRKQKSLGWVPNRALK
jgi:hypothetical protein